MKTQEYRLVDAKNKVEADNVQRLEEQIKGVKKIINPKDYQCIAMNGHIFFEGAFHPDAIVVFKIPRPPVDYGISTYPRHLQEEMQKIQRELNLTKDQVKEVRKSFEKIDLKITEFENQCKHLRNIANQIKEENEKEKLVNNFNKRYSSFHECLTSKLITLDNEAKDDIRNKLDMLVQLIDEVKQNYLCYL